ncbi:MAG: hypothetical protein RL173_2266 [Fibrobacterota bacterium]|jgi:hypothetical protein
MQMTKSLLAPFALAAFCCFWGCGSDSGVSSTRQNVPCRDETPPSTGSLYVTYSNPTDFDTVIIWLDPRDRGGLPYQWSPNRGTRSDVVKGLGFVKYWITARYVRAGDTVDVFDSETIDDGASTNSAGCKVYDPQSSVGVEVEKWPR